MCAVPSIDKFMRLGNSVASYTSVTMPLCIIEKPYLSDIRANVHYSLYTRDFLILHKYPYSWLHL